MRKKMRGPTVQLARLYMVPEFKVVAGGTCAGLAVLTLLSLVLGAWFVAAILLLLTALAACLLGGAAWSYRSVAIAEAEWFIECALRTDGLDGFELEVAVKGAGLPAGAVRRGALRIYQKVVDEVVADLEETEDEREMLDLLGRKLNLPRAECRKIERELKSARYRSELERGLSDGRLTEGEQERLCDLRAALGLSEQEAYAATEDSVTKHYRNLFQDFVEDGHLSSEEQEALRAFRESTGLSAEQAADITHAESLDLYARSVRMMCQDGCIREQERQELALLKEILDISDEEVVELDARVARTAELQAVRTGSLPRLPLDEESLEKGEVCHFEASCTCSRISKEAERASESGRLIVTDRRILFTSDRSQWEFAAGHIRNIRRTGGGVFLEVEGTEGRGHYEVDDPEMLEAILNALAERPENQTGLVA